MRAIKIDSKNRIITEVDINDLEDMQKIVEGYICLAFDHPDAKHSCFVNDEGLLNSPQYFFAFLLNDFCTQPFAGDGIIVGGNEEGDNTPCTLDIEELKKSIYWFTLPEVQFFIREGMVDYNTYYTPLDEHLKPISERRELITTRHLGAFDKKVNK